MRRPGGGPDAACWVSSCLLYGLEIQLQSQLDDARVVSRFDLAEVPCTEVVADATVLGTGVELSVIPDVKELRAELEVAAASFTEHEVLEEGDVPVVAAGANDGVPSCVAPAVGTCGARRCRVNRGVEPFRYGVWIVSRPGYVGAVQVLTVVRDDAGHVVSIK